MNDSVLDQALESLSGFRQQLYESFSHRCDATMNLIDSLSANRMAHSVVELSLNAPFDREYSSVYDAIESGASKAARTPEAPPSERQIQQAIIGAQLPACAARGHWLIGIDTTPNPRPFAATLPDRGIVYQPNPAPGNKPIAVGHTYSLLTVLPEQSAHAPPWVVPLDCQRVSCAQQATAVAATQVSTVLRNEALPFARTLSAEVVDSGYCRASYLSVVSDFEMHVVIARCPNHRVFYHPAAPATHPTKGHPLWYGEAFKLKDPDTWGAPDAEALVVDVTKKGRPLRIELRRWNTLLMRGTRTCPMHQKPFDVLQAQVFDALTNQPLFTRPMWLLIMGARRTSLSAQQIFSDYRQRFNIEHFIRFAKQHLLADAFQTPVLEREEHWWWLACLSYIQLWLASLLTQVIPNPWQRYLPSFARGAVPTPSQVQRDFARIIRQVGTPAQPPKRRGKSPGRAVGSRSPPRQRCPVIFKGKKRALAA